MKKRITILAATKRKNNGVCIAGIDSTGSWVRPVKLNGGYFVKSELFSGDKVVIDCFNEVDFELDEHMPVPPNTEDYKISDGIKPVFVRQIIDDDERLDFLSRYSEESVETMFNDGQRALGLVECSEIIEIKMGWTEEKKFYSYIEFKDPSGKLYNMVTTDLRWAAFGKNIMKEQASQPLHCRGDEIIELLKHDKLFFSLGLARTSYNKLNGLVIGVITIPDYAAGMNFWDLQSRLSVVGYR